MSLTFHSIKLGVAAKKLDLNRPLTGSSLHFRQEGP